MFLLIFQISDLTLVSRISPSTTFRFKNAACMYLKRKIHRHELLKWPKYFSEGVLKMLSHDT